MDIISLSEQVRSFRLRMSPTRVYDFCQIASLRTIETFLPARYADLRNTRESKGTRATTRVPRPG
jgi:hypothetical protein